MCVSRMYSTRSGSIPRAASVVKKFGAERWVPVSTKAAAPFSTMRYPATARGRAYRVSTANTPVPTGSKICGTGAISSGRQTALELGELRRGIRVGGRVDLLRAAQGADRDILHGRA